MFNVFFIYQQSKRNGQVNGEFLKYKSYKSEMNGQTDRQAGLRYIHVIVQSKVGHKNSSLCKVYDRIA